MKAITILSALTALWMSATTATHGQGLKTLEELTESAPVIVTGTVQEVRAETGEYDGREVFILSLYCCIPAGNACSPKQ